jgi:3-oxoacyl-[acyl-carrier-protein] synthase II
VLAAPFRRYQRVHLTAAAALSCAGDARETWQAVSTGQSALHHDPDLGWVGRIADECGDLLALAEQVARPVAAQLPQAEEALDFPGLWFSASKGDSPLLFDGDGPERLIPALPGSICPRLAGALELPTFIGGSPVAACATGLYALLEAADAIEEGRCRRALAGAVDRSLQPLLWGGFRSLGVLCQDQPPQAMNGQGTGFAPAEGAAAVGLSRTGPWKLVGGVRLGDASHETRCADPQVLEACLGALWSLAPEPDAIVVHGTGTRSGDAFEQAGLDSGPWSEVERIVCKPLIGHSLGANALVELVASLESPHQRLWKLSLGFGGHIAACVVDRIST